MDATNGKVPVMLTIKEVSVKTGLPYERIRLWCLRGEIVYVMAGNKYLINYEKFLDFLNGNEVHGSA